MLRCGAADMSGYSAWRQPFSPGVKHVKKRSCWDKSRLALLCRTHAVTGGVQEHGWKETGKTD